ncbi:hypothetical protein JKP88DRAFT_168621, partial [Tribonema minus]
CHQLTVLPDSINGLAALKEMNLHNMPGLAVLPDTICALQSLVTLEISECSGLTSLPGAVENLQSLREVCVTECTELATLLDSFARLSTLQLSVDEHPKLTGVPDAITQMSGFSSSPSLHGCLDGFDAH